MKKKMRFMNRKKSKKKNRGQKLTSEILWFDRKEVDIGKDVTVSTCHMRRSKFQMTTARYCGGVCTWWFKC